MTPTSKPTPPRKKTGKYLHTGRGIDRSMSRIKAAWNKVEKMDAADRKYFIHHWKQIHPGDFRA